MPNEFVIKDNVYSVLVEFFDGDIINLDKNVIEVGPGPGALTRAILTAGARKVIAIEKDVRFIDALKILKKIVGIKLNSLKRFMLLIVLPFEKSDSE